MKKKVAIISFILILIAAISIVISYLYYESVEEKAKEKLKQERMPAPASYCLITYKVSTDNGKTWHEAIINSGQKPIYKAECWKKYIHILDGFTASIRADGKWYNKSKKGKIISNPLMHFSNKPFASHKKKIHSSKKEHLSPKKEQNKKVVNSEPDQKASVGTF